MFAANVTVRIVDHELPFAFLYGYQRNTNFEGIDGNINHGSHTNQNPIPPCHGRVVTGGRNDHLAISNTPGIVDSGFISTIL